jgi:hypothetical protein
MRGCGCGCTVWRENDALDAEEGEHWGGVLLHQQLFCIARNNTTHVAMQSQSHICACMHILHACRLYGSTYLTRVALSALWAETLASCSIGQLASLPR